VQFIGTSELIGILIPNQRIDRLTKYIKELENKLKEFLKKEECIDIFEESFIQASRTLSDERRSPIASIVKNGLDEIAIEYSTSKYMLKLLQELNDQEPYIGGKNSLLEKKALTESFQEHLERLGLIRTKKITKVIVQEL